MAQDIYRPLDPTKSEFRILRILPAKFHEPIRCELVYSSLDLEEEYEALSYTWGGHGEEKNSVFLDGKPFDIRENLAAALPQLRRESKARIIWIDAVCINQSDEKEKWEQV